LSVERNSLDIRRMKRLKAHLISSHQIVHDSHRCSKFGSDEIFSRDNRALSAGGA
jgi:hypothetical protein